MREARHRPDIAPFLAGLLALAFLLSSCTHAPPSLSPEAVVAFHATRVVKVLDVVRDAAIAANDQTPPLVTTRDTRAIVLWHQTAVQVIAVSPDGWKPIVRASIYALTCHPAAGTQQPCTPQLPLNVVARLYPYIGLALIVMAEVP